MLDRAFAKEGELSLDGAVTATLTGRTNAIHCMTFSSGGRTLATGSDDHTARLWKIK